MSYRFGGAKRYDVLTHSYDFAYGKSYDMIAYLTSSVASPLITASLSEHHNYAERIITCRQAIIVDFRAEKVTPTR